jgi:hypothetical protein
MQPAEKESNDIVIGYFKQIMGGIRDWADHVVASVSDYLSNPLEFVDFYTFFVRWIFPVLAVLVLVRCVLPLLRDSGSKRIWGFLEIKDAYRIPILHWENSIGRSKLSDIVINLPFISRSHAVLSYGENGWTITDLASKGGVRVNGEIIEHSGPVEIGDTISFATAEFQFVPSEEGNENIQRKSKLDWLANLGRGITSGKTILLILAFQLLGGIQVFLSIEEEATSRVLIIFLVYMAAECCYYSILSKLSGKYRELELLIFFLCGLNLLIVASSSPEHLLKQLVAILLGMIIYAAIQLIIKDVGRGRKLKYLLVAASIVLIALNLILGETRFGARNWINLGFITFQPMEFVKVAFVLAGTATLDKLLTTRNLTAFIGFSGACIGALILMRDLGTSVIFFVTFLVVAFMRSGDIRTIAFISAGAALGAFAVVSFLPYIASRLKPGACMGICGYHRVSADSNPSIFRQRRASRPGRRKRVSGRDSGFGYRPCLWNSMRGMGTDCRSLRRIDSYFFSFTDAVFHAELQIILLCHFRLRRRIDLSDSNRPQRIRFS